MNSEEFESLLEGGAETQGIDFKQGCKWNEEQFVKDILAMSNIQNGGYIVIGVRESENGGFEYEGISGEQKSTYQIDIMRDQVSKYADPKVTFEVEFTQDKQDREYVVIHVIEFDEIPVVCKRDGKDVKQGVLYYRNTNRRVESAPVSNAYDLQNIIRRAAVKVMQNMTNIGFTVPTSVSKKLAEELSDLSKIPLLDTIKSRGYWLANFKPAIYDSKKIKSIAECKSIIINNVVQKLGWRFPYILMQRGKNGGLTPGNNFFQGWINTGMHKEFWRLYQSGQFVIYKALQEDWYKEDDWGGRIIGGALPPPEPMSSLDVFNTTYQVAGFFIFLSRLVQQGLYDDGVVVDISLNNTKGRELLISDPLRGPLLGDYKTASNTISEEKIMTKQEILSQPKELIVKLSLRIFDSFGWHKPNENAIRESIEIFFR